MVPRSVLHQIGMGSVSTYYVDMKLTLSVDEETLAKARKAAVSQGISLDQAIRRFLEEFGGDDSPEDDITELLELSEQSGGHSRGWRFNREEIHERS